MIGFQPAADKFFIFMVTLILLTFCGSSLGKSIEHSCDRHIFCVRRWLFVGVVLTADAPAALFIGVFFACAFPVLQLALTVTPMILLPLMLFGGLFVNTGTIPVRTCSLS